MNSVKYDKIASPTISLATATRVWASIGLLSFGGPAAQIALMHRLLVEDNHWITEKDYLNALSFCMMLPGPEAMQLATYAGWRMHGVAGGLIAGLLFVLPGAVIILALVSCYAYFGNVPLVSALFLGIKAAVLVVVFEALIRVAKRALKGHLRKGIALAAFIALFFLNVPYPLIIIAAAVTGFFLLSQAEAAEIDTTATDQVPTLDTHWWLTILCLAIAWLAPWLLLLGTDAPPILTDIYVFFSRLAVVTFGGAYAVLAYMGQDVVEQWQWLTATEMMDGLGLAETTPGPLILVTEFVGFLAAYRVDGWSLGLTGAIITLWVTFVPCFLWIFAGAPFIDWIGAQPRLKGALQAISAAVVGVILNLSVWFSLHVLFRSVSAQRHGPFNIWIPNWSSVDWRVVSLTVLCAVLAFRFRWPIIRILMIAALAGVGFQFALSG